MTGLMSNLGLKRWGVCDPVDTGRPETDVATLCVKGRHLVRGIISDERCDGLLVKICILGLL